MTFRTVDGRFVRFDLPVGAQCPCQSGRVVDACCMVNGELARRPSRLALHGAPTGERQDGCYAAVTANCGGGLTREHFASEAILERLNLGCEARGIPDGDLSVEGFSWAPVGSPKSVPPAALAARVLCARHNSGLGPLDAEALKLFRTIDTMDAAAALADATPQTALYLMSGHDLERWLLKMLLGLTLSGALPWRPGADDVELLERWALRLFDNDVLDPPLGLYVPTATPSPGRFKRGFAMTVTHRTGGAVGGLRAEVSGYPFFLLMNPGRDPSRREYFGVRHVFRPFELHTTAGRHEYSVVLSWQGAADHGTVNFQQRAA